jgi:hypothetical protein
MFLRSGKFIPGPSAPIPRPVPQPVVANPPRQALPREAGPAQVSPSSAGPWRTR